MKTKKLFLFIVLGFTFFSCKIENKDQKTGETTEQPKEEYGFKVTANVISKDKDDFCLLYTEDGTIHFGENVVWMSVPAKQEAQNIDFYLPVGRYPTQLRFDLGLKQKATDTIYLKSVHFDYLGKKLDIEGAQLGLYFRADENHCTFDPITGAIIPIIRDGKVQHPCIYPQEVELGKALKRLAIEK